jgi:hypothetical protein
VPRQPTEDNNLATRFPGVASEWHTTANNLHTPSDFFPFSGKKAWWICVEGHEYEAGISSRTANNSGCPYCSGLKVTIDKNFAVIHPLVASEWDYQKNKELLPEHFAQFSGKKVWWKCKKSHEWKTTIATRSQGSNCPFCWKHTSVPEFRLLAELEFIFGPVVRRRKFSGLEVDLFLEKYQIGFEYDGSYWHKGKEKRDHKKHEQLAEMGIKLLRVREKPLKKLSMLDVLTSDRGLRKQVIDELLGNVKPFSDANDIKKIDYYISENEFQNEHIFRKYLTDLPEPDIMNSLANESKELLSEFDDEKNHPLEPKHFSRGSQENAWWKCEKGHSWKTGILTRTINKSGCPYCSRNFASPEFNLQTMFPEVAAQWHLEKNGKLSPSEVLPASSIKRWWICKEGHHWQTAVSARTSMNIGCPFCGGVLPTNENNLAAIYPKIKEFWHSTKNKDLKPENLLPSTGKRVWLKCNKGHEWQAVPNDIQNFLKDCKADICPECRRHNNSLANKFPDLLHEWDYEKNFNSEPNTISYGSKKKFWWKCAEGHPWETSPNQRTKPKGASCPLCSESGPYDQIPVTEKNCLLATEPKVADEWDYALNGEVTPKTVRRTCKERVWWKCPNGHSWEAAINVRAAKQTGCSVCAPKLRAMSRKNNKNL